MEKGAISKEFFIGRFLYLKDLLDNRIPNVRYMTVNGRVGVTFNKVDKATGQTVRRRIPSGTDTAHLRIKEQNTKVR